MLAYCCFYAAVVTLCLQTFNDKYEAKAKEQLGKMEEKYGESVEKNRRELNTVSMVQYDFCLLSIFTS